MRRSPPRRRAGCRARRPGGAREPSGSGQRASARRREEVDELNELGRAERVDVDVREAGLDAAEQILVPLERQGRVHAALHEDLRAADVGELGDLLEDLILLERVGVVVARVAPEGAEGALGGADVGVVDVAVDDVGADGAPVEGATAGVGGAGQGPEGGGLEELEALVRGEAEGAGGDVAKQGRVGCGVGRGGGRRGGDRGHAGVLFRSWATIRPRRGPGVISRGDLRRRDRP